MMKNELRQMAKKVTDDDMLCDAAKSLVEKYGHATLEKYWKDNRWMASYASYEKAYHLLSTAIWLSISGK